MTDKQIDEAQVALAKAILNRHVRRLRQTQGRKAAVNVARQIARHGFAEAGVELTDECSVHELSPMCMQSP